ncbi:MAG: Unknown protein [uncultured Aureispira sp.]|uniref:Uncharacterized protein n=1 Tax=uncultured Aureispira sp. TaxID=1331704 RepID=A0A6S6SYJ2_9BACT|nr:MAG: Unknown protein [uncultured Aureispira sp.]
MFANASILYAAGLRQGDLVSERFVVNRQNSLQQPALEQKKNDHSKSNDYFCAECSHRISV